MFDLFLFLLDRPSTEGAEPPEPNVDPNHKGRATLEFLIWLKETPLAEWVLYSPWANPILLCMHASGMALVVGCGLMTCLRILGYARNLPISLFERLIGFAWLGVALNVISGILLFIADGDRYIANWTFQLKLGFIFAAGIATWFLWRLIRDEAAKAAEVPAVAMPAPAANDPAESGSEAATPDIAVAPEAGAETAARSLRIAAVITALFWIGAIIAGRMIAYTISPGFD